MKDVQNSVSLSQVKELIQRSDELTDLIEITDGWLNPQERRYLSMENMVSIYSQDWLNENKLNGNVDSLIQYVSDKTYAFLEIVFSNRGGYK